MQNSSNLFCKVELRYNYQRLKLRPDHLYCAQKKRGKSDRTLREEGSGSILRSSISWCKTKFVMYKSENLGYECIKL